MSHPDRKKRLAELEAMQHHQDDRAHRQGIEHAARTQLALLRVHLLKLGLLTPDQFAGTAQGNWWDDPDTGELRVWFLVDGCAYYRKDGLIYVEREARGRLEWTILDADGEPVKPWSCEAPPRARSAFN